MMDVKGRPNEVTIDVPSLGMSVSMTPAEARTIADMVETGPGIPTPIGFVSLDSYTDRNNLAAALREAAMVADVRASDGRS